MDAKINLETQSDFCFVATDNKEWCIAVHNVVAEVKAYHSVAQLC
jgi:hypothetical protein